MSQYLEMFDFLVSSTDKKSSMSNLSEKQTGKERRGITTNTAIKRQTCKQLSTSDATKGWMEKSRATSQKTRMRELSWEPKKKKKQRRNCRIILLPSGKISPFYTVLEEKATYMQNIIRKVERLEDACHVCRANNEISPTRTSTP